MQLLVLDRNKWNRLNVCKKKIRSDSFENVINELCLEII